MKQIEEMAKVMANDRFCEPNEYQTNLFIRPSEALYNAGYRKQSEVAREIFADIEKFTYRYLNDADYSGGDLIYDLAELKNKYTEVEE